jgi:peptidoglycan/xylan/chitin deacetylase (PgdA/CDA1 family)
MYHYVRDLKHSRYPKIKGLDSDLFKNQIEYILKYYKVIRMEELFGALVGNNTLPNNSILLTFDDGFKDHFEYVFPILDEMGLQGSFFPSVRAIIEKRVLDVHKISFILSNVDNKRLLLEEIYLLIEKYSPKYRPNIRKEYNKISQDRRFDNSIITLIKALLQQNLPIIMRRNVNRELFYRYVSNDEKNFAQELYMNIDQLKCMIRHGMYIGNHGWDHYRLNKLSKQRQRKEIEISLKFMKSVGCDVNKWAMCYPHGSYNESIINLLKNNSCMVGFSTEVGIADIDNGNPFALPRLDTNDLPKDKNAEPNEWTKKVIKF